MLGFKLSTSIELFRRLLRWIQGDFRWRLGKRQESLAQARLHEAIVPGALVAYVPAIVEQ
jgi:hypothetical protein